MKAKIDQLRQQMRLLDDIKGQLSSQPDGQLSMTDPDAMERLRGYLSAQRKFSLAMRSVIAGRGRFRARRRRYPGAPF